MSNVFESWMLNGVQAQFETLWRTDATGALKIVPTDAAAFISKTISVLDSNTKVVLSAAQQLVPTRGTTNAALVADAALYDQIVGLWHTFSRNRSTDAAPAASATSGDTFKILANGDVVIQDKDGKTVATAQSRSTITESDFQKCHDMKTGTKESCVKYLAFVAGVGTDTNRVSLDFSDLGKTKDGEPADLHVQVAHAYAVLKRVNWYAHTGSEDAFAYTFEDFSVEERKESSLQSALQYMLVAGTAAPFGANPTDWAAAVADMQLSRLGRLVKACYKLVNANPAIKNAIVEQQRFSPTKVRSTGPLARMTSLKGPMRTLHGMYAAPGHSSHVLMPMLGAGQVGGGSSTAAGLRAKLDGLLPVLAQNNKRLSAETFAAFTRKLNTLETYEKEVQEFMGRLRNVSSADLNSITSAVVSDTDLAAFDKKSQAVTRTTAVLSNALGNIAHYGRPIIIQNVAAPAAPAAASHYTL
jgi:hypothetical protein